MTCSNCGYVMCYICRLDIRKEGYQHFCQHFRVIPGSQCAECKNCNLYQKEADDKVVKEAARLAKLEWMRKNPAVPTLPDQVIG
jgi:hypothetical protein